MRRTHVLIRPLLAAAVIAAILVPAAFADTPLAQRDNAPVYWSYDYQAPVPHPRTVQAVRGVKADPDSDTPWTVIAVTLAGVCLVLGAATVLPRRTRPRIAG
jgi:hypothetical protein